MSRARRDRRPSREETIWKGHPSWRGFLLRYLRSFLVIVFVLFLVLVVRVKSDWVGNGFVAACLLLLGGGYSAFAWITVKVISYEITTRRIEWVYGILNRRREQAPIARITDIVVEQTIPERLLGIGRINFDTASEANPSRDLFSWWGIRSPRDVASEIEYSLDGNYLLSEEELYDEQGYPLPPPVSRPSRAAASRRDESSTGTRRRLRFVDETPGEDYALDRETSATRDDSPSARARDPRASEADAWLLDSDGDGRPG